MDYPLKILHKHLANEKLWLACVAHDAKSVAGKRMAQERVPQLEVAIEVLKAHSTKKDKPKTKRSTTKQLDLWQSK